MSSQDIRPGTAPGRSLLGDWMNEEIWKNAMDRSGPRRFHGHKDIIAPLSGSPDRPLSAKSRETPGNETPPRALQHLDQPHQHQLPLRHPYTSSSPAGSQEPGSPHVRFAESRNQMITYPSGASVSERTSEAADSGCSSASSRSKKVRDLYQTGGSLLEWDTPDVHSPRTHNVRDARSKPVFAMTMEQKLMAQAQRILMQRLQFRQLFVAMDVDHDGVISFDDLAQSLRLKFGTELTSEELQHFYDLLADRRAHRGFDVTLLQGFADKGLAFLQEFDSSSTANTQYGSPAGVVFSPRSVSPTTLHAESEFNDLLVNAMMMKHKAPSDLFKALLQESSDTPSSPLVPRSYESSSSSSVLPLAALERLVLKEVHANERLRQLAKRNPRFVDAFIGMFDPQQAGYVSFTVFSQCLSTRDDCFLFLNAANGPGTQNDHDQQHAAGNFYQARLPEAHPFNVLRRVLQDKSFRLSFVLERHPRSVNKEIPVDVLRDVLSKECQFYLTDAEFSQLLSCLPISSRTGCVRYHDMLRNLESLSLKERGHVGVIGTASEAGDSRSDASACVSSSAGFYLNSSWAERMFFQPLRDLGAAVPHLLYRCDSSGRGQLGLQEFVHFLGVAKLNIRRHEMHALFESLPHNEADLLDTKQFLAFLGIDDPHIAENISVHLHHAPNSPSLSPSRTTNIARRTSELSPNEKKEYLALQRILQAISERQGDIVRLATRTVDRNRTGRVSVSQYRDVIFDSGVVISDSDFQKVVSVIGSADNRISYHDVPQLLTTAVSRREVELNSWSHLQEHSHVMTAVDNRVRIMNKHVYGKDSGDIIAYSDSKDPSNSSPRSQVETFRASTRSFFSPSSPVKKPL
eukprot:ANDGO_04839.mRNA.1 hypothetical protein